jgi:DNA polymerase
MIFLLSAGQIVPGVGRPQPQNLPGSGPKTRYGLPVEWGIEVVESALVDISTRHLSHVESVWGDAVAVVSGCLRGLFSAAPGHDLICSDYSAIEAVVLAELAGETWRQEVFRTHGKIYEMSASKISGVPFEEFARHKAETGQHHPLRKKIGKVAELASGYGGGLGAWKAFGADDFMTDDEIQLNVRAWRVASPAIAAQRDHTNNLPPGFWYGLQEAALSAIQFPGYRYSFRDISYYVLNDIMYCLLPSGRTLTYHAPRMEYKVMPWGATTVCITYSGWNSNYLNGPIGWMRLETYGPKLTENVVQAVARDLLAFGMKGLDAAGYGIVLHVHDEVVVEVPEGWGSVEEVESIMATMPLWANGWPVKAAGGWRGKRYRKG